MAICVKDTRWYYQLVLADHLSLPSRILHTWYKRQNLVPKLRKAFLQLVCVIIRYVQYLDQCFCGNLYSHPHFFLLLSTLSYKFNRLQNTVINVSFPSPLTPSIRTNLSHTRIFFVHSPFEGDILWFHSWHSNNIPCQHTLHHWWPVFSYYCSRWCKKTPHQHWFL